VIGHYRSEAFAGVTLFASGSRFDDARFRAVWGTVADVIADTST
jgi:hypothetical protein